MQLKCSDYLMEAVSTENEQRRLLLLGRACKQISQILPFKKLWNTLLVQKELFQLLLLCECMFGQNIKLILNAMNEKLCQRQDYCSTIFQSADQIMRLKPDRDSVAEAHKGYCDYIFKNLKQIKLTVMQRIRDLVDYIVDLPQQSEYDQQAHDLIRLFKGVLAREKDQDVIIQACKDTFYFTSKWSLIKQIDPNINNEIEDILMESQYRSEEIPMEQKKILTESSNSKDNNLLSDQNEEEEEQEEKKSKLNILRKQVEKNMKQKRSINFIKKNHTQIAVEHWLAKGISYGQDTIPIIEKGVSDSVNTQEFFKIQPNLEMLISFILEPLRFQPAKIWNGINEPFESENKPKSGHGRRKLTLLDIPNFRDLKITLQQPAAHFHIRSIRTLQCLTDEQNHIILSKANPRYLQFTFNYLVDSMGNDMHPNLNHVCLLLQFYLKRESELTVYYFLSSNLQHRFLQNLHYDQVAQFIVQLLCQMTPNLESSDRHQRLTQIDQCWNYFDACGFFGDLAQFILKKEPSDFDTKANPMFRNHKMLRFLNDPDETLDEKLTSNFKYKMNFIIEEMYAYHSDIDKIKPLVRKKFVKALSYFSKYMVPNGQPKIKLATKSKSTTITLSGLSIMQIIKNAIQETYTINFETSEDEEPDELGRPRRSKSPVLVRGSSVMQGKDEKKIVQRRASMSVNLNNVFLLRKFRQKPIQLIKLPSLLNLTQANVQLLKQAQEVLSLNKKNQSSKNIAQTSIAETQKDAKAQSVGHQSAPITKSNILYPMSLRDIHTGELNNEERDPSYCIENLIKRETSSYNAVLVFSMIINQLVSLHINQNIRDHFRFDTLNFKQYIEILFKNSEVNIFDCLMKHYLLKIKMTPLKRENSALQCGRLINTILKHLHIFKDININSKIVGYLIYLDKVLVQSFEWGNSNETVQIQHVQLCSQMETARIELCETLTLFLENAYRVNNQCNLLNYISSSAWSTLLSYFTENRTNNVYQNIFRRIFHIIVQHGTILTYHTIFLKLNSFSYFKKVIDQAYRNKVLDKSVGLENYFAVVKRIIVHLNEQVPIQPHLKVALINIETLESWKFLKEVFGLQTEANHTHASFLLRRNSKSLSQDMGPSFRPKIK